jgi:cytidylate kinase
MRSRAKDIAANVRRANVNVGVVMPDVSPRKSIAISRQHGSGGSYIAQAVAERLGFRYFDREMLRIVAEYLSEHGSNKDAHAAESWFDRLGTPFALGSLETGYVPPAATVLYEGEIVGIEERLIREIVDDHVGVIVGRGAAQLLRGHPRLLTVFVHAPEPWRVDRVQQVYKTADRAQALRMVRQSDQERTRFIRKVANLEWTDPCCYDLAINSKTLGFDAAVDLLVRLATATTREAATTGV